MPGATSYQGVPSVTLLPYVLRSWRQQRIPSLHGWVCTYVLPVTVFHWGDPMNNRRSSSRRYATNPTSTVCSLPPAAMQFSVKPHDLRNLGAGDLWAAWSCAGSGVGRKRQLMICGHKGGWPFPLCGLQTSLAQTGSRVCASIRRPLRCLLPPLCTAEQLRDPLSMARSLSAIGSCR